jgi:hypothetical protein
MAAGEHRSENSIDGLLLAHDAMRDLGAEPAHGTH